MRTIIHDLDNIDITIFNFTDQDLIINANKCKNNCIGCFSCWIKHPTKCMYNDDYSNIPKAMSKSDEFILISKNRYGAYSSNVKRALERCIGYVLPYFTIRDGMIHHEERYKKKVFLTAYFYGDITDYDKDCLYDLVKANGINLNCEDFDVKFIEGVQI